MTILASSNPIRISPKPEIVSIHNIENCVNVSVEVITLLPYAQLDTTLQR